MLLLQQLACQHPHIHHGFVQLHCANHEPRASGVGAQSGAPGPSRECRPLLRAVMLYL